MDKYLVNKEEISSIIRKCYESDVDHILKVHVDGDEGLEHCILRTVADLALFDVDVYSVFNDNDFIGYFGEENSDNSQWLTGFFIMPDKRKAFKPGFWMQVVNHFNGNFKSGVYSKNEPARKFLMDNGCRFVGHIGSGSIFEYCKEGV